MAFAQAACLYYIWIVSFALSQAEDGSCIHRMVYRSLNANSDQTVYLSACDTDCCPSENLSIIQAWMVHPHRNVHFQGNVLWDDVSDHMGIYLRNGTNYFTFMYRYNCSDSGNSACLPASQCLCQDVLQLELRIANFQLLVDHHFKLWTNASLTCVSGLEDSREIQVNFTFVSTSSKNQRLSSCDANQPKAKFEDGWIIYRTPHPPYDCVLQITNASIDDAGEYQCMGFLPTNVSGKYQRVTSNTFVPELPLISAQAEDPTLSSRQYYDIGILTVSLVVVLVLITVVVIYLYVYRIKYKLIPPDLEPEPEPDPEPDHVPPPTECTPLLASVHPPPLVETKATSPEGAVKEPGNYSKHKSPSVSKPSDSEDSKAPTPIFPLDTSTSETTSTTGTGEHPANVAELDAEIHVWNEFERVKKQTASVLDQATPNLHPDVPYDPNLRCPCCDRCYKLGLIQYFRRHVSSHCPEDSPQPEEQTVATGQLCENRDSQTGVSGHDMQSSSQPLDGCKDTGSGEAQTHQPATGQLQTPSEEHKSERLSGHSNAYVKEIGGGKPPLDVTGQCQQHVATGVATSPDIKEFLSLLEADDYTVAVEYIGHVKYCTGQQKGASA